MRQRSPATPIFEHIKDGVENFSPWDLARRSTGRFFLQDWRNGLIFGIIEIGRVCFSGFHHSESLPDFVLFIELSDSLLGSSSITGFDPKIS